MKTTDTKTCAPLSATTGVLLIGLVVGLVLAAPILLRYVPEDTVIKTPWGELSRTSAAARMSKKAVQQDEAAWERETGQPDG